ncbi:MAG: hypothetical protein AB1715_01815 [Acidobacteriota bacterium]
MHLIPLKDELDQQIIPTESNPLPYSTRYTCAPCHDYGIIQNGLHFNAARSSSPGRPGEPWVWVDEKTGTLLPLSYWKWPGSWDPAQVGLSAWDFTLLFGRHLAGGGVSEPSNAEITPDSRWEVSGKVEINCLGCHNASNGQDSSEWTKQVLRENFRWAATAASRLGEVGGMASRLAGTWDVYDGPDPDDTEWAVPPFVRYEKTLFDSRHRVLFDLTHKPADSRCLACHSVAPVETAKYAFDEDVHSAAGLKCAHCHRNDLSHAMIRGYEGEAEDNLAISGEDFTCAACHLGNESAEGSEALAGRLGAPYPRHKGLPAVHLKRLACTVCHSGPWPGKDLTRVRTSRANRLGIYGIARWSTDLPAILEPVYIRDRNGKLTPHRLIWPAFWAERKGRTVLPLKPGVVAEAAGDILTPEQGIVNILTTFTQMLEADQVPVFVYQGKAYEVNVDRRLNSSPHPAAPAATEPHWAIRQGQSILPLIPEFDSEAEEIDPEILNGIQRILEALAAVKDAPGKPVLIQKKALFQVTETYLEKLESPAQPAVTPQLAWLVEGRIEPLVPEFELKTIASLSGFEQILTEEQVWLILQALAARAPQSDPAAKPEYIFISSGKIFRLDKEGRLESSDGAAAEPVVWPLAHEVRPARQSLGINGCKDCHRFRSAFLFRKVRGTGPLQTARTKTVAANSFMRLDRPYQALFGLSFAVRPLFKWALFICLVVIGAVFMLVILLALGRLSGLIEKRM